MGKFKWVLAGAGVLILTVVAAWVRREFNNPPVEQKKIENPIEQDKTKNGDGLPMTWERVEEIIEKQKQTKRGQNPDGISAEDNRIALQMKLAQTNGQADGKGMPWRGELGGSRKSPYGIYFQMHAIENEKLILKEAIPIKLAPGARCIAPANSNDPSLDESCIEKKKRGLGGAVQVYGEFNNEGLLEISKLVYIDSVDIPGAVFETYK